MAGESAKAKTMAGSTAPPPLQPKTGRAAAYWALIFSFAAFLMSGFVLFQTYDDGRLVKNFKVLTGETSKVFDSARKRIQEKDRDGLQWDKIKDRIDRIETMIQSEDGRAAYYIDVLKSDLNMLRDYTTEKGAQALKTTTEALESARSRLGEDAEGAASKLRDLSKEIEPRIRALKEDLMDDESAPSDDEAAEPGAAPEENSEPTEPDKSASDELKTSP
jgi:hypothetical protein